MLIKELTLDTFRNYKHETFLFHKDMNIFIGDNAQGKTNILEAIYLLSTSKSFKTHVIKEMIMFQEDFSKIHGLITSNQKDIKMDLILSIQGKKAMINKKDILKTSDYLGYFNAVLFLPDDLLLVKGSPVKRRQLIDQELSKISPIYMYNINNYHKLLKERNAYLKLLHEKHQKGDTYLDVLSQQLADIQVDIINRRTHFIKLLDTYSSNIYKDISHEELSISYKTIYKEIDSESILERYKKYYDRDISYSHTVDGIHKDDLSIKIDHKDASLYASQGQIRSIVLSMKIGLLDIIKLEIGEYPVLLLDDVLSELDDIRKNKLLSLIKNKVQTFITSTSLDGIDVSEGQVFHIRNGGIVDG